jgi:nitroreductase
MREFEAEIMSEIKLRWSPRAFSQAPVAESDITAVLEAARWAPSCFNEQPWRFVVGTTKNELEAFHEALLPKNALWAKEAPVMILICAEEKFAESGKVNPYHAFDTGTAWGFLALEAQRRGLVTHAMAGFKKEQLREALEIPEHFVMIALVALGKYGDAKALDPVFWDQEKPGVRKSKNDYIYSPSHFKEANK